jgi:hypothetical protein
MNPTVFDRMMNGDACDVEDAVAFAESILEDDRRASDLIGGPKSIPAQRRLNLARAFLKLKYPFLCCGEGRVDPSADGRCALCPMRAHDLGELPPEDAERGRREGWWT